MNFGTRLRTILAIATALNTANVASAFAEFDNPILNMIYKAMSLIALIIVLSVNTYYNNDYSKIAAEHTGAMRLEKEQMGGKIEGENFLDDFIEEDENEEE